MSDSAKENCHRETGIVDECQVFLPERLANGRKMASEPAEPSAESRRWWHLLGGLALLVFAFADTLTLGILDDLKVSMTWIAMLFGALMLLIGVLGFVFGERSESDH